MDMHFPPEMPEEIKAAFNQAAEKHMMAAEAYRHGVMRMFSELTEDQLGTLRHLFRNLAGDSSGALAAYYEGQVAMMGELKFGVCAGCGVNHDKEAEAFSEQKESVAKPDEPVPTHIMDAFISGGMSVPKETIAPLHSNAAGEPYVNQFRDLTEADLANMDKYHLDDLRDEDQNNALIGFICTGIVGGPKGGCGMKYGSITDRMVKGPEECSGCFTRAAHG